MKLSAILLYLNFGLSSATVLSPTPAPSTGTLTVNLSNFRNDKGNAVVELFYGEKGFPKLPERALKIIYVPIKAKRATAIFENLPPGEYAVSVYHDENNNRKMDTNFFGIPKEGVGASNNARGHFGPPMYSDAKFNFNGGSLSLNINITYL
jgi:uncharacterized protein (DUF2141 family)